MLKVSRSEYRELTGRLADDGENVSEILGIPVGAKVHCLHCGGSFLMGDELVDAADGLLVCPTLGCNGTPLDWSEKPWSL